MESIATGSTFFGGMIMANLTSLKIDPAALRQPLSESEINELADFLESDTAPDTCMTLEQADGFMCALAVGPHPIPMSGWLPILWGSDQDPEFESAGQAQRILTLLLRHWNSVMAGVRNEPREGRDFFVPLVYYPGEDTPDDAMDTDLGKEWAEGFAMGINVDEELWDACMEDEDIFPCFGPVILLELGHNPDRPDMVVDYARRKELVLLLPLIANEFYRYWREHAPRSAPLPQNFTSYRNAKKPGRNDPCTCGSGKKFKKCCGSPENLH
jgi:uncharacterized protein